MAQPASGFPIGPLRQPPADQHRTNRLFIKPEIGVSKAVGPLTLEGAFAVTFYTDNNDFFGGKQRSQDPLYSVRAHAIYNFPSGLWGSFEVLTYRRSHNGQRRAGLQPSTKLARWRHSGDSH